jgi:hypothetical protein
MPDPAAADSRRYVTAFELHNGEGCPTDFRLPPAAAAFECGVFLPRADPDWFGRRAYPPRVLLLCGGALWIVAHPTAAEAPRACKLERLAAIESGRMLLRGWLGFKGRAFDCTAPYNTRGQLPVGGFLRRLRQRWLGECRPGPPAAMFGDALDMRFANALEDELDPGEAVSLAFFEPPRERRRRWPARARRKSPGDLMALTSRRLLWITDRDGESRAPYGGVASYAPLRAVRSLRTVSRPEGSYLQADVEGLPPWVAPLAPESLRAAGEFAAAADSRNRVNASIRNGPNFT